MSVYALFISCSKYGDLFSASFEAFSYFLPSPLAGSLFLFKLLGNLSSSHPNSLLKCAGNSCYLSNRWHIFYFNNGGAIEDQEKKKGKEKWSQALMFYKVYGIILWNSFGKKKKNNFSVLYCKFVLLISEWFFFFLSFC